MTAWPIYQCSPCSAPTAVLDALTRLGCGGLQLKWPNDVLLDGRKVCGVLTESTTMGQTTNSVVGIGLNVNPRGEQFPADLGRIATSLAVSRPAKTWSLVAVATALLDALEARIDQLERSGPDAVVAAWSMGLGIVTEQVPNQHLRRGVGRSSSQDFQ